MIQLNWGISLPLSSIFNQICVIFESEPKLKKTALFLILWKNKHERAFLDASIHDSYRLHQFLYHLSLSYAFKTRKNVNCLCYFLPFFVHNILPQVKEGVLSPHFNKETFIGILFIDRPISIDMFVLVKKLSTGLIWDSICWEARALRLYRHSQPFCCAPQASIWLLLLKSSVLLRCLCHFKDLTNKN